MVAITVAVKVEKRISSSIQNDFAGQSGLYFGRSKLKNLYNLVVIR